MEVLIVLNIRSKSYLPVNIVLVFRKINLDFLEIFDNPSTNRCQEGFSELGAFRCFWNWITIHLCFNIYECLNSLNLGSIQNLLNYEFRGMLLLFPLNVSYQRKWSVSVERIMLKWKYLGKRETWKYVTFFPNKMIRRNLLSILLVLSFNLSPYQNNKMKPEDPNEFKFK